MLKPSVQFTLVGGHSLFNHLPDWIEFNFPPGTEIARDQLYQGGSRDKTASVGHLGHRPYSTSCGLCYPGHWSFYETGITSCNSPAPFSCVLPRQPFVLATLVLPGPTSAGTAIWDGVSPPVYTGDNFTLTVPVVHGALTVSPAFTGYPVIGFCHESASPSTICDFDISWSETAGDLIAVRVNIDAVFDDIGGLAGPPRTFFGLTGGPLASDHTLGGCGNTQCTVTGYWQSDLALPEPMSAVLLITGLLATCLARSRLSG